MHILVVDDEEAQRMLLAGFLEKKDYTVTTAASGKEAIDKNRTAGFDLAILDLKMPEIDGVETMAKMKEIDPETDFIILTGYGTVESAVEAMKLGAYDYLNKPINLDELELMIERIHEEQTVHRELEVLREEIAEEFETGSFVAESKGIKEVLGFISRVAKSDSTVLIQGESGTGKEMVARLIHKASNRQNNRFIPISCAALPETLLESELFGYERGAFSGAEKRKIGKFELAHRGTLFLDEIGDLPLSTQVKLLRVLQEFTFERLGSNTTIKVDVRLITATNQDLEKKISDGTFREDLYYRLNVIAIVIPPLKTRKEDIKPLVEHFINKFSCRCNKKIKGISKQGLNKLLRYDWPGNIRELENVIERAVVLCRSTLLESRDFPLKTEFDKRINDIESLHEVEKEHIKMILKKTDYSLSETAKRLCIHRNTLRLKMKEYGIKKNAGNAGSSAT
ncbi:MAG: sigma-54-dependent Fis family transcriptional regulator [Candidatus Stahlbacteria bacterium]|nr:MAG: sigma-54-dependent Fis family transcriptional regulator [Candidatus Stahlbacteria bacterium]